MMPVGAPGAAGYMAGSYFTGYNACNGLVGGWNGGGYANWNLYGAPRYGFRGCNGANFVGLGGDGNGVGW